jgi:hypothetical protein
MLTAEYVRGLFDYEPETGRLIWRVAKNMVRSLGPELRSAGSR